MISLTIRCGMPLRFAWMTSREPSWQISGASKSRRSQSGGESLGRLAGRTRKSKSASAVQRSCMVASNTGTVNILGRAGARSYNASIGRIRLICPTQPQANYSGSVSTAHAFHRCWILSGPTGSGKTAFALQLAEHANAEIIAMDSMTLYRGMDIGTAKPSTEERRRLHHHLLDVLDPWESASVAWWL